MTGITQEEVDEQNEEMTTYYYELGQSSGLSIASTLLLDQAVRNFKQGHDSDAIVLRSLSQELKVQSDKRTPAAERRP